MKNHIQTIRTLAAAVGTLKCAASNIQTFIRPKLRRLWLAMTIAGGLASAGVAQGNIVYNVNASIGAGGVVGTITTDGAVGVLQASDILAWNLTVTGNGGATFDLVNGASGVEVGNNTAVFNPTAGTPDLTADANNIYFNFSGTDGGYFGFQTLPFYGGQNYWSCGASNNSDTAQGFGVVPVLYSDPSSIYVAESGNQIIAQAATAGTNPSSFVYNNFAKTKRIRFNGSATNATTGDGPVLKLTPASANQAGSAFTSSHLALSPDDGFGTFFMFRLSHPGNTPAGGMTFTIQSAGSSSLGGSGSGLGYSGITNSLSVGFGADNSVSVNLNGVLNTNSVNTNTVNNGNIWYAWVDYEGVSQDLAVRLAQSPVRPLAPTLTTTVNLPSILRGTNAFVGFTGATGAGWYEQDILAWKFAALSTTRVTGTMNLTNLPAGFQMTNSMVLMQYLYDMDGITMTQYVWVPVAVSLTGPSATFQSALVDAPPVYGETVDQDEADIYGPYQTENDWTMCSAYEDSMSPDQGVVLSTYDDGEYPNSLNDYFDTVLPSDIDEPTFTGLLGVQNLSHLPPDLVQAGIIGKLTSTNNIKVFFPRNQAGVFTGWTTLYSRGVFAGTMSARQQVLASPPVIPVISTPRVHGTNFLFDFATVQGQSFTVWAKSDLATTNWSSYTNLTGDGYVQEIAVPVTNQHGFFRLSSP